jgi:hypothetical protein
VDLQKKLSKKQLAQYEREEGMFAKPGNINIGMTTRAQSQAGLGFASRVTPNLMQTMETNFGSGGGGAAMSRNISNSNLSSPVKNQPKPNLMTASPNTTIQFGRSYATRMSMNNFDESGDLANSANAIPSRTGFVTRFTNPIYDARGGGMVDIDLGNPVASSSIEASVAFINSVNQKLTMRQRIGSFINKEQTKTAAAAVAPTSSVPVLSFTNPAYVDDLNFRGSNEAATSANTLQQKLTTMRQRAAGVGFKKFQTKVTPSNLTTAYNFDEIDTSKPGASSPSRNFMELKQKYGSARQRFANVMNRIRRARQASAVTPIHGDEIPLLEMEQDESGNQLFVPGRGSVPRKEFMHYASKGKMQYPNILRMVRRGIVKHKRSLMIAGGVIGGAAIVGGILGGTLSHQSKKSRKEMQNDSPVVGVFERLSGSSGVGGGGGGGGGGSGGRGGYGNYQRQMPFTDYGGAGETSPSAFSKSTSRRRKYTKKNKSTTKKQKATASKGARSGGGSKVVVKGRINKSVRKIKKSHHSTHKKKKTNNKLTAF